MRSVSTEEAPALFETLDGCTYRLAWLYGFARALQKGDKDEIKAFQHASQRCPVKFEMIPDVQAVTARKL